MWSYVFRRVLAMIPTLFVVITVCYLLLHATPGGPFDSERKVSAVVLANLNAKYHLDLPLWQQYLYYLNSLLHGDLGASFRYEDWSVNDYSRRCRSSCHGGGSILISLVLGVFLHDRHCGKTVSLTTWSWGSAMPTAFPSFVIGLYSYWCLRSG